MAGLHSPSMLFAITRPMGPARIRARAAFTITAFSPVAPADAPARSMALVASALVPTATISCVTPPARSASMSARPKPPPCPSMITISIFRPPYISGEKKRRNTCASHLYSGVRSTSAIVTSWLSASVARTSSSTSRTMWPP